MEKWEYKSIHVDAKGSGDGTPDVNNFTMVINQLGSVGWELVSCLTVNQDQGNTPAIYAVMKRKTGSGNFADQPSTTSERAHAFPEKGPRTFGDKQIPFGKGPAYGENRGSRPVENRGPRPSKPPYSGDKRPSSGFKGKSSGGYKGKGPGNAGKGSWK